MATSTTGFAADDFTFRVPISFTDDPVDLSGATVEALAQSIRGGDVITGSVMVSGTAEIRGAFADGVFDPGTYRVQVRVTLGDITQTVAEWLHTVSRSL